MRRPVVPGDGGTFTAQDGFYLTAKNLAAEEGYSACTLLHCREGTGKMHAFLAHFPAVSERSCIGEVAYFNARVAGVLSGPEAALGLFWQGRLLAYCVSLSSIGNTQSTEALCLPMSMAEHIAIMSGTSTDPRLMMVAAAVADHGVSVSGVAAMARSDTAEKAIQNFAAGTSTASAVDKMLRGHAVNGSETSHNRNRLPRSTITTGASQKSMHLEHHRHPSRRSRHLHPRDETTATSLESQISSLCSSRRGRHGRRRSRRRRSNARPRSRTPLSFRSQRGSDAA